VERRGLAVVRLQQLPRDQTGNAVVDRVLGRWLAILNPALKALDELRWPKFVMPLFVDSTQGDNIVVGEWRARWDCRIVATSFTLAAVETGVINPILTVSINGIDLAGGAIYAEDPPVVDGYIAGTGPQRRARGRRDPCDSARRRRRRDHGKLLSPLRVIRSWP
jgi:hypothetical protein